MIGGRGNYEDCEVLFLRTTARYLDPKYLYLFVIGDKFMIHDENMALFTLKAQSKAGAIDIYIISVQKILYLRIYEIFKLLYVN